ncbi:hypothetical protein PbJCM13498_28020 [Prolixibacter bellariivorans]|uniref:Polyketide cyclase n=1 Tax=Prolixibacter bellariivorans TaxID=314319 RepID=A0A5M4B1A6_9BACT|nr:SRPBCC domain-containing protein [Prolixibacter bellariivorans]GET33939.1 hypothetical protein PbJCM13498_28020 [Prolixibacter bellariivorans]
MRHENIHITTDIDINASKETVWKALTDIKSWQDWASLVHSCRGNVEKDGELTLRFINPQGGSYAFKRTVFLYDEGNAFGWTGDAFAGMKDFHVFELESIDNQRTRFIQSDGLHGADVPGIKQLEQAMLKGYEIFNQELKNFIEDPDSNQLFTNHQ